MILRAASGLGGVAAGNRRLASPGGRQTLLAFETPDADGKTPIGLVIWFEGRRSSNICRPPRASGFADRRACLSRRPSRTPTACTDHGGCRRATKDCETRKSAGFSGGDRAPEDSGGRRAGGRSEIRTHGGLAPTAVFKTAALNHSAILPSPGYIRAFYRRGRSRHATLPPFAVETPHRASIDSDAVRRVNLRRRAGRDFWNRIRKGKRRGLPASSFRVSGPASFRQEDP